MRVIQFTRVICTPTLREVIVVKIMRIIIEFLRYLESVRWRWVSGWGGVGQFQFTPMPDLLSWHGGDGGTQSPIGPRFPNADTSHRLCQLLPVYRSVSWLSSKCRKTATQAVFRTFVTTFGFGILLPVRHSRPEMCEHQLWYLVIAPAIMAF